jgi:hypothetical protein
LVACFWPQGSTKPTAIDVGKSVNLRVQPIYEMGTPNGATAPSPARAMQAPIVDGVDVGLRGTALINAKTVQRGITNEFIPVIAPV